MGNGGSKGGGSGSGSSDGSKNHDSNKRCPVGGEGKYSTHTVNGREYSDHGRGNGCYDRVDASSGSSSSHGGGGSYPTGGSHGGGSSYSGSQGSQTTQGSHGSFSGVKSIQAFENSFDNTGIMNCEGSSPHNINVSVNLSAPN